VWQQRDLSALTLMYLWADGVYVNAGLEGSKAVLLVLIGADAEGRKHVLAVTSGELESVVSLDLRAPRPEGARTLRPQAHDHRWASWALGRTRSDLSGECRVAVLESHAAERARPGAEETSSRSHRAVPADRCVGDTAGGGAVARHICPHVPSRVAQSRRVSRA
jgi:hypothetical protein